MDTIVIKIKCRKRDWLLNKLREQGLLFDTIRQALDTDTDGVQEITDEEYGKLGMSQYDKS